MGSNPTLSAIFSPSSKCATKRTFSSKPNTSSKASLPPLERKSVPMCSVLSLYFDDTLFGREEAPIDAAIPLPIREQNVRLQVVTGLPALKRGGFEANGHNCEDQQEGLGNQQVSAGGGMIQLKPENPHGHDHAIHD